jgi:glycosyltransferase involved in cell wall biosynthesis
MAMELQRLAGAYDIVLANQHMTALPTWFSTRWRRNGYYYIQAYEPEMYDPGSHHALPRVLARATYRLKLTRIVNSPTYTHYKELRARHIVEPGLDTSLFNQEGRREWAPPRIEIGCIGRHERWKGTAEIIEGVHEAIARLGSAVDLRLNIAFQLPDKFRDNLPPFARLLQPHGDRHLARFYKDNDIFVATGLLQDGGFHYPCAESLACGCTVISNYAPGTPENCHFLTAVTSKKIADAIDAAVSQLLKHRGRPNTDEPAFDLKRHDWDHVAAMMRSIFSETQTP